MRYFLWALGGGVVFGVLWILYINFEISRGDVTIRGAIGMLGAIFFIPVIVTGIFAGLLIEFLRQWFSKK